MRRLGLSALAAGTVFALATLAVAQDVAPSPAPPAKVAPVAAAAAPPPPAPTPHPASVQPDADSQDDAAPSPAPAAPPPEPPKPPPPPLKRPRFDAAIMQGVDKITAETLRFEAKVGEPVRYKGLILTVRACETTASDEPTPDNVAYLDVQSQPEVLPGRGAAPPRQVFKGWMFASSPTLHPFEHPVYDLWLIACKAATPGT